MKQPAPSPAFRGYTAPQAAVYLGISRHRVIRLMVDGYIKCERAPYPRSPRIFTKETLDNFIKTKAVTLKRYRESRAQWLARQEKLKKEAA